MEWSPCIQRTLLFVPFLREIRYASMRAFPERMILTAHKLLFQKQRKLDFYILRSSDTERKHIPLGYPGTLQTIRNLFFENQTYRWPLCLIPLGSFFAGVFLLGSVLLCDYKIQQFFDKFKMEFYTNSRKCIWWDSLFLFPAPILSLTGKNPSAMMDSLGGPQGPLFSSQIIYLWNTIFLLHFPSSWGIMY